MLKQRQQDLEESTDRLVESKTASHKLSAGWNAWYYKKVNQDMSSIIEDNACNNVKYYTNCLQANCIDFSKIFQVDIFTIRLVLESTRLLADELGGWRTLVARIKIIDPEAPSNYAETLSHLRR